MARLLLPVLALGGLGVGVFFGVDALLDDGDGGGALVSETTESVSEPPTDSVATDAGVTDATDPAASDSSGAETSSADDTISVAEPAAEDSASVVPTTPRILTAADLDGAPVILERGAARPVPAGIPDRTWANGDPYDPTDAAAAFSSVWAAGTVVEITRLPGAPLLSEEDAAELIGKTIRVVVQGEGSFPEELQLTPATYALVAQEIEPIIAVRIEVIEPPPEG